MITQMLLLRFQICAVVAVLYYRHRKYRMPRVVTISVTDEPNVSATISRIYNPQAPPRSPFNSHPNAASPKRCSPPSLPPPEIRNAACRRDHGPAQSFGGNFTHSRIRRRCHDRRSTRIEMRHPQSVTRATARIRRHDTASFKYPSIRCYRSNSRYQVTPHRTSCPCLVSFSVGHYDVLVSTPDSMFSVV